MISDSFLQRRPGTVPLPPAYGQLHREARLPRLEERTLRRWGALTPSGEPMLVRLGLHLPVFPLAQSRDSLVFLYRVACDVTM